MMAVAAVAAGGAALHGRRLAVLMVPAIQRGAAAAAVIVTTVSVAVLTMLLATVSVAVVTVVVTVAMPDVGVQNEQVQQVHRDARQRQNEHHCGAARRQVRQRSTAGRVGARSRPLSPEEGSPGCQNSMLALAEGSVGFAVSGQMTARSRDAQRGSAACAQRSVIVTKTAHSILCEHPGYHSQSSMSEAKRRRERTFAVDGHGVHHAVDGLVHEDAGDQPDGQHRRQGAQHLHTVVPVVPIRG